MSNLKFVPMLLVIVSCFSGYTSSPPTPISITNWRSLKVISYSPNDLSLQNNTINIINESNAGAYGKRNNRYYSNDHIQVENSRISFTIGITNPSLFTMEATEASFPAVFDVVISNKSAEPIEINWDNVAYVDDNGIAHKVVKSGTRIVDRTRPQGNLLIPPNAKVDEMFHPADFIYYEYGNWLTNPVLEDVRVGNKVSIFIPITFQDGTVHYNFTFSVESSL